MPPLTRRAALLACAAAFTCAPELLGQTRRQQPASGQSQTARPADNRPATNAVANNAELTELQDQFRLSREYTLEVGDAMPAERYNFRPSPDVRSFGQQLVHVAESNVAIYQMFIEQRANPTQTFSEAGQEQFETKDEVLEELRTSYDYISTAVPRLSPVVLAQRVEFFGGRDFSKQRVLRFMLDHATHHRSQLLVYLRLNGVRPPQYRA